MQKVWRSLWSCRRWDYLFKALLTWGQWKEVNNCAWIPKQKQYCLWTSLNVAVCINCWSSRPPESSGTFPGRWVQGRRISLLPFYLNVLLILWKGTAPIGQIRHLVVLLNIHKKKGIADETQNDNCNAALLNVSVSGAFHLWPAEEGP
jgi:hypothetical protein